LAVNGNPAIGSNYDLDTLFDTYAEEIWLRNEQLFRADGVISRKHWRGSDGGVVRKPLSYLRESLQSDYPVRSILNAFSPYIAGLPIPGLVDHGASKVAETAFEQVETTSEPFFQFINFLDAHHNYRNVRQFDQTIHDVDNTWESSIPEDWAILFSQNIDEHETYVRNRRQLYAAAIEYLDRLVADHIERVQAHTDGETTVIVTADHGENLGYPEDDRMVHHKSSMTESLLHVPFEIINPPDGYDSPETGMFSQLELGGLLDGFEKGKTPDVFADRIPAERIGSFQKESFERNVNRAEGFDLSDDEIDEAHAFFDRVIRVVYDGTDKYQWDSLGTRSRYRLDIEKPCWQELDEELSEIPEFALELFDVDIETVTAETRGDADTHETGALDAKTREQLSELGYL
jgi:hypothetical protein